MNDTRQRYLSCCLLCVDVVHVQGLLYTSLLHIAPIVAFIKIIIEEFLVREASSQRVCPWVCPSHFLYKFLKCMQKNTKEEAQIFSAEVSAREISTFLCVEMVVSENPENTLRTRNFSFSRHKLRMKN